MHRESATRKASDATSDTSVGAHPLAFAALILANILLSIGPVFVRMSDVGPVAAGFWRIALAAPILVAAAFGTGWRPGAVGRGGGGAVASGGVWLDGGAA